MPGKTIKLMFPEVVLSEQYVDDVLRESGDALVRSSKLLVRCAKDTYVRFSAVKPQDRQFMAVRDWWNGVFPEFKKRLPLKLGRPPQ